ncbi:MAG: acyltransferase [Microbacteriaceae bacterium]|nr:acyltransferase [Microbacteriaceae bacterium]
MSKAASDRTRRDIQYLRALAVASVVVYHFWPNRLVSGFLGVDVFFVISGFLITSLIVREVATTSTLSLTNFWVRRIRRIFPAAIVVIIATAIATNATLLAEQVQMLGRHVFASAFSFENVLLGLDAANYDRRDGMTSPLQHYWSLSVEEQFYLVWPILVLVAALVARKSKVPVVRILAIVLGVIAVASLVYAIAFAQGVASSYFDTFARAWELAIGAAVALWAQRPRESWRWQFIANRVGWAVLAVTFFVPGLNDFAPGIGILPAVLATALILATGPAASARTLPLSRQFLSATEWLGDRSYSVYLWHWPIVILLPIYLGRELGLVSKVAAIALTLVLAELTYRFVENPVRYAKWPWTFKPAIVGAVAFVTSAAVVTVTFLAPQEIGKQEPDVDLTAKMLSLPTTSGTAGVVAEFPYVLPYCDGAGAAVFDCERNADLEFDMAAYPIAPPLSSTCQYEEETFIVDCVMGDTSASRRIALVGDSHARAMWASLDLVGKRAGYAVHEFLTPRCSYRLFHYDWCTEHNRDIELRLNSGEFDLVILAQSSSVYNPATDNPINPFGELWGELKSNGVTVAVVKDSPKRGPVLSQCLKLNRENPGLCTRPFDSRIDRATQTALDLGFPVIELDNAYCPDNLCEAVRGGMFMWRDNGHISAFYHLTAPLLFGVS